MINNYVLPKMYFPLFQRLSLSQRSLHFIGPQIWNSRPDNILNITCLSLFKRTTKNI